MFQNCVNRIISYQNNENILPYWNQFFNYGWFTVSFKILTMIYKDALKMIK